MQIKGLLSKEHCCCKIETLLMKSSACHHFYRYTPSLHGYMDWITPIFIRKSWSPQPSVIFHKSQLLPCRRFTLCTGCPNRFLYWQKHLEWNEKKVNKWSKHTDGRLYSVIVITVSLPQMKIGVNVNSFPLFPQRYNRSNNRSFP